MIDNTFHAISMALGIAIAISGIAVIGFFIVLAVSP